MKPKRILWADDEIDLLQPHIIFLQSKGYYIDTVTNGDDAISKVSENFYDIVLLDERMTGKDGLATLNEIKSSQPQLPVIMITKSEEESLMEDAIGQKIDDYLTKPVNPSQILLACKKLIDRKNITTERKSRQYADEINQISTFLMNPLNHQQWIDLYLKITNWDLELDEVEEGQFREILYDQRKECNVEFCKYIEKNYSQWVSGKSSAPMMSTDLIQTYLIPELKSGKKIVLLIVDCMRLDQWLILEPYFYNYFNIKKEYYYSILPTATPFSRNSIFGGIFPAEIEKKYPNLWKPENDNEGSLNRFEDELLAENLKRNKVLLQKDLKYIKIMNNEDAHNLLKNIDSYLDTQFLAIVLNFVDILAHSRSDLPILKEIAPNEAAYRSLTKSWFEHSAMYEAIKAIAKEDHLLFITTDHGSVRGMKGTKVIGDRETSTNLRYKFGRSLKVDKKNAIFIKNPDEFRLPKTGINTTFIIAKEDYYFVYPTNYHKYLNYYKDSFQHGGVSLEEMILPFVRLESKK
ncbi:response regulator [Calditrichota bacterium]